MISPRETRARLSSLMARVLILVFLWLPFLPIEVLAQIERVPKSTALSSEAPSLRFEQLSLEEGLAQASAFNIIQDKSGFLWIATQGGLHRYDGHDFKIFTSTPFDTTSLSDSWVWGATEAEDGTLWVTTQSGGLNRLDPTTGKSIHYRHDPDDSTSISSDNTFASLVASNGDLWVSGNRGLDRMRVDEDGKFTHYKHDADDPNSLPSNALNWISEDNDGKIWVGSNNGISQIDPETGVMKHYLDDRNLSPIYGDPENISSQYLPPQEEGLIWLATGNGLVRLEAETGQYKRYLIEANDGRVNPLNFLHDVHPDPKDANILWVGGPGTGIARFDMRIEEFTSYRNNPIDKTSLRDNEVNSLFLDRSGQMWVGTAGEGLNSFNPGAVNFTNVRHIPNDPTSLAPGMVWGIYEDSQGTLWVGSRSGTNINYLTEFNAQTRKVRWHQHNPKNSTTLLEGTHRAFAEDNAGQFWIGGRGGLNLFDRSTGIVTRYFRERVNGRRSFFGAFTLEPVVADPSKLWVGGGAGLEQFDTKTGKFTTISLIGDDNRREPGVYNVLESIEGTLWVGTLDGLYSVNSSGGVKHESVYNPLDTTSISDNTIYSIVERNQEPGILWLALGNGGGLNRFDTKTSTATHLTMKDGLANDQLYGILVDDNGTLWMSTNGGISNYDPETKKFRNYGLDEGLMALEYDQNAYAKGASGMLYFGSGNGVSAFAPELLSTNAIAPQVAISDIKVFNKSITADQKTSLSQDEPATSTLLLDYDENEVTLDFVALHFANPGKNQYSYQLEGFDTEWIPPSTKRTATYTNLPPGEYTFKVKAANADGVWNEQGSSIIIVVAPPWYRTWWAYVLFAAILALVIFGVDRFQRSRINKKELERATLREAELRAEAENNRRADTEELSKIGRAITSTLSIEKIIETVYENVNALMDAAIFGAGIYNKEQNRLDFPATKEAGEVLPAYSNHLEEDHWLSVWCFKHKQEIVISDFDKEYDQYLKSYSAPIVGKSPKSVLYMPLIQKNRIIGVITTQSFEVNAYTAYHVNLLRNLANYAAIALDNASAYRKLDATIGELRSTQEQLVQSEKMASLGELTAGIAHEIQNPLNFVNNFSDVSSELADEIKEEIDSGNLDEVKSLATDLRDNLNKINHHGQRASEIVKGMLQHSRTSSGEKELTDINVIADEYLRLSYHGLRAKDKSFNAEFEADLDETAPKINVIPQDIGRVLLNLINNAFHAVKGENKPKVVVTTSKEKNNLVITVSDNGPGIPEDIKDKIFQPFFTTKITGEGTGLGLSISYDIITKGHGGELKVDSTMKKGTKFIINLPFK